MSSGETARVQPFAKGDRISVVLNSGHMVTATATDVVEREDGSLHITFEESPDLSRTVGLIDASAEPLFELGS